MKKKIGVMTWYFGANYGAIAQSLALNNTIKSLGYDCYLINYRPEKYKKTLLNANLPPKWRRFINLNKTIAGLKKCKILGNCNRFEESIRVYTSEEIDSLRLSCIVFGSDAIFNLRHPLCDKIYYGVGIHTKKVAYSPSCEYLDVNTLLPKEYRQSLKEMAAISVRDINTANLILKNTGVKAQITLDPTFLFDFSEYKKKISDNRYILVYAFSSWNQYSEEILKYARMKNLLIIAIGNKLDWADISLPYADFDEWVSSFSFAELVITDSFHGTVFSLKNQKQIVLCGRKDKESKIRSLLDQLDVKISIYEGESIDKYLVKNTIDYAVTQKNIDGEIEKSLCYLKNALETDN